MLHCPIHSLSPGKPHLLLCQHHTDFWGGGLSETHTYGSRGWREVGGWGSQRDMNLKVILLEFGMSRTTQCQKYLGSINTHLSFNKAEVLNLSFLKEMEN